MTSTFDDEALSKATTYTVHVYDIVTVTKHEFIPITQTKNED